MGIQQDKAVFERSHQSRVLVTWHLDLYEPQQEGQSVVPETLSMPSSGALLVGRAVSAEHVQLRDLRVSRRHAQLLIGPEGLAVEDLNSANGTFVNGQRIHAKTWLNVNDQVSFDRFKFRVRRSIRVAAEDDDIDSASLSQIKNAIHKSNASSGHMSRTSSTGQIISRYDAYTPVLTGSLAAVIVAGIIMWLL